MFSSPIPDSTIRADSRWLPLCDRASEWIIYFMVVFSPWAFGTTQPWSVAVMNGAGYALGVLWLLKKFMRGARPWNEGLSWRNGSRWFSICLGAVTLLLLSYVLVGALNARATYFREEWRFEYRTFISWLPHSYDRISSLKWFWNYLALACSFWAIRDWLTFDPANENGATPRWHRLLWIVSLNGAAVALQGLLQRADGSLKLLWLVEPRVNKSPESFFGPYAYRANASQFLNLIWPVTLAFWCALQRKNDKRRQRQFRLRHLLLPCAALTAIAPVVAASRGGALVSGVCIVMACLILFFSQRSSGWGRIGIAVVALATIFTGWLLGWDVLAKRMVELDAGFELREKMFKTARFITEDYPLFGTGAGSFDAIFQLYRSSPDEYWPAQLHNDWLETLVTFGWLGISLILVALALVCIWPFVTGRNAIRMDIAVIAFFYLSLGSCLVHARYDFPFQIYSILFLFLLIGAVLSCSTRRKRHL